MVRIRLRRVGSKKQPSYRIVVADSRKPRDGRYIEVIGFYNPRTEPATMTIQEDRALYWLSVGAQPSDAVNHILDKLGTLGRLERLGQGESMETLVAEAEAEQAEREPVSPKTTHAPASGKSRKAQALAAAAKAEAEVETETEVEVEAEVEAEADVEDEAVAESEAETEAEG